MQFISAVDGRHVRRDPNSVITVVHHTRIRCRPSGTIGLRFDELENDTYVP